MHRVLRDVLQTLFGPGAVENDLPDRVQAAVDLVVEDAPLPSTVGLELNRFFADQTLDALRKLQRAFIVSGMEGLSTGDFIDLVVEGAQGGWLGCSEAALALSRLDSMGPGPLPAPAQRLAQVAFFVAHEEAEGWRGACDDTLFRDAVTDYIRNGSPAARGSTMGQMRGAATESQMLRILPDPQTQLLPDLLDLTTAIPDKDELEWRLLDLEGMHLPDVDELAPGIYIGDLTEAIDASPGGVWVPWADLERYASRWTGIAWLTVDARSIGRHYFLKNFDSSWWDVSSNDQVFLARLRARFEVHFGPLD